jgi:hypothetical protein
MAGSMGKWLLRGGQRQFSAAGSKSSATSCSAVNKPNCRGISGGLMDTPETYVPYYAFTLFTVTMAEGGVRVFQRNPMSGVGPLRVPCRGCLMWRSRNSCRLCAPVGFVDVVPGGHFGLRLTIRAASPFIPSVPVSRSRFHAPTSRFHAPPYETLIHNTSRAFAGARVPVSFLPSTFIRPCPPRRAR